MSCNNCKRLAEEIELGTVTVENLNKDIIKLDEELDRVDYEKSQLQAENKRLKEFARFMIKQECWGYDMDGFEIQGLAEKLGLIKEHVATEEDVDEFSDFEVGDKIYKFTDVLKGTGQ